MVRKSHKVPSRQHPTPQQQLALAARKAVDMGVKKVTADTPTEYWHKIADILADAFSSPDYKNYLKKLYEGDQEPDRLQAWIADQTARNIWPYGHGVFDAHAAAARMAKSIREDFEQGGRSDWFTNNPFIAKYLRRALGVSSTAQWRTEYRQQFQAGNAALPPDDEQKTKAKLQSVFLNTPGWSKTKPHVRGSVPDNLAVVFTNAILANITREGAMDSAINRTWPNAQRSLEQSGFRTELIKPIVTSGDPSGWVVMGFQFKLLPASQKSIKAEIAAEATRAFQGALSKLGNEIITFAKAHKNDRVALNEKSAVFLHQINSLLKQFENDFTIPYRMVGLDFPQANGVEDGKTALKKINTAVNNLRYMQGISVDDADAQMKFWGAGSEILESVALFAKYAQKYLLTLSADQKPGVVPEQENQPEWYKRTLKLLKYVHDVFPKVARRPGMTEMHYDSVYNEVKGMWDKIMMSVNQTGGTDAKAINSAASQIKTYLNTWQPGGVHKEEPTDRARMFTRGIGDYVEDWLEQLNQQDIPA